LFMVGPWLKAWSNSALANRNVIQCSSPTLCDLAE